VTSENVRAACKLKTRPDQEDLVAPSPGPWPRRTRCPKSHGPAWSTTATSWLASSWPPSPRRMSPVPQLPVAVEHRRRASRHRLRAVRSRSLVPGGRAPWTTPADRVLPPIPARPWGLLLPPGLPSHRGIPRGWSGGWTDLLPWSCNQFV